MTIITILSVLLFAFIIISWLIQSADKRLKIQTIYQNTNTTSSNSSNQVKSGIVNYKDISSLLNHITEITLQKLSPNYLEKSRIEFYIICSIYTSLFIDTYFPNKSSSIDSELHSRLIEIIKKSGYFSKQDGEYDIQNINLFFLNRILLYRNELKIVCENISISESIEYHISESYDFRSLPIKIYDYSIKYPLSEKYQSTSVIGMNDYENPLLKFEKEITNMIIVLRDNLFFNIPNIYKIDRFKDDALLDLIKIDFSGYFPIFHSTCYMCGINLELEYENKFTLFPICADCSITRKNELNFATLKYKELTTNLAL